MIKIIDSLYLTEKGCSIKKRNYHPVHIRQGDIDGACAVYSLMMNLLILKTISRVQIEDVYDNIKKSPETEKLFHEFFDKHGMIRGGFYFDRLTKLVNRVYGEVVTAQYSNINDNFRETDFWELVKTAIDDNIPIILGMDFKTGGGHAVPRPLHPPVQQRPAAGRSPHVELGLKSRLAGRRHPPVGVAPLTGSVD